MPMNVSRERARSFLAYGFAISIVAHVIVLPFVNALPTAMAKEPDPGDLRIVNIPTPPPTPRPTPTPRATLPPTPPPHATPHAPAPHARPIKIHTQVQDSTPRGGRAEAPNAHEAGDVNGIPGGDGTPGPAASAAPAAIAAQPTPSSTPRPTPTPLSCARPQVPATTVHALEPDTPAMAAQQGISGTVGVVVSLDAQSRIVATRVQSSPSALLNGAALAAARGSQFRTEVKNCEPVAADYLFSVEFTAQ